MKRTILFLFSVTVFVFAVSGCDDEDDTATQSEVAKAACDKTKKCDEEMYNMIGGDEGCEAQMNQLMFSDCENYDDVTGADCIDDMKSMTCEEVQTAMASDDAPGACNNMCD